MIQAQVEYLGFTTRALHRAYDLRFRRGAGEPQDVTIVIPIEAFTSGRLRYQDGPEICFLRLHRELLADGESTPGELSVSDAELLDYRAAHAPKQPQRRPRPPLVPR